MNRFLAFLIVFPGVAAVGVLIPLLATLWFALPAHRRKMELLLVTAALAEPAGACAQLCANALSRLRPLKYDLYIFKIDRIFGLPSFRLGQLAAAHRWLHILIGVSYGLLPIAMFSVFAVYVLLRSEREAGQVLFTFALNLFAALPVYLLLPVCGPVFAFHLFPSFPDAHLATRMIAINSAPNGIPSVHASSALLILFFLRRWPWGRVAGSVFLALTVLATLGSGQHYAFDLLCAIPYSLAVIWLSRKIPSLLPIRLRTLQSQRKLATI